MLISLAYSRLLIFYKTLALDLRSTEPGDGMVFYFCKKKKKKKKNTNLRLGLQHRRLLAHLVYQPKSLIQSCFVRRASSSSVLSLALVLASASSYVHTFPGTGLDIETSCLVFLCTHVPHIAHQIFCDSDL